MRVKFWNDRWYKETPLEESFPMLLFIVVDKDSWIANVWKQVRDWGGGVLAFKESSMIGNLKEWRSF